MPRFGFLAALAAVANGSRANSIRAVITIVLDDLGYHDLGFTGSGVATPLLDKLHEEGIEMANYYVTPICTPSRAALLTGRYPIRTGMQGGLTIQQGQSWGLNLNETTLPQIASAAGWDTHAVGKWHLGYAQWQQTPTFRGFGSFYGYYLGAEDYYLHTVGAGYDFHRDTGHRCGQGCSTVDWGANGTYSAFLFAAEAEKIISQYSSPASPPLFLYLAMQSVHAPVQAPEPYVAPYRRIFNDTIRQVHAGMLAVLDEAIGNVTRALEASGLAEDSVVIVTTDNGGPSGTVCGDCNGALNWPLRGGKHTLYQGGVKGTSFVWSKALYGTSPANRSYTGLAHITDWLPTTLAWMGLTGSYTPAPGFQLDGVDQSAAIQAASQLRDVSALALPRSQVLLNVDCTCGGGASLVQGDWKLLLGDPGAPYGWDPAVEGAAQMSSNDFSPSGGTAAPSSPCNQRWPPSPPVIPGLWPLLNHTVALYNITADPQERSDVAAQYPAVVQQLTALIGSYAVEALYPVQNGTVDPAGSYLLHNGSWVPWLP